MPPQTNATLQAVHAASSGDSYEGPAGGIGPEEWAGAVRVYWREKRDRERSGEGETRTITPELFVDRSAAVPLRSGQLVTFLVDGDAEPRQQGIRLAEDRKLAEVPPDLETVRLTLVPA